MKNFNKWFGNFDCDTIDCGGIGCDDVCKEIRAETWRAALEWVLSWETEKMLRINIQEELKDENKKILYIRTQRPHHRHHA